MAGTSTPQLNESQARLLLAVMWRVDELLATVDRALEQPATPFDKRVPDLPTRSKESLRRFVESARGRMVAACVRLGIRPRAPTVSARGTVATALEFAANALADIGPTTMRGYGPVSPSLARELEEIAGSLQELMGEGLALVERDAPGAPLSPSDVEGGR